MNLETTVEITFGKRTIDPGQVSSQVIRRVLQTWCGNDHEHYSDQQPPYQDFNEPYLQHADTRGGPR